MDVIWFVEVTGWRLKEVPKKWDAANYRREILFVICNDWELRGRH
jgi:hypothetical protein